MIEIFSNKHINPPSKNPIVLGNKNKRNAHSIFSVSKQKYIYLPPASQFTHPALIHNQRSNSFCSSGDNDDPSQTLPSATTSSVSQFSSPQVNWERSHSSSNLNNSNANKKKMCVDLKEEKHGMRLMMLPSWPTTANASASHVLPNDLPQYLPQKNLAKEVRRENIIQQVNTCSKDLQASSAPPPPQPQAGMDLKHYDYYNVDDTLNSTRCPPPHNQTGTEARQTVRKTYHRLHEDITARYPTDFDAKWNKDAEDIEEQHEEGDFLIRHEADSNVEEIKLKSIRQDLFLVPRYNPSQVPSSTVEIEHNERSKSKNKANDNENNKSKNGLSPTTEELGEEGKRAEVCSRSEAFLSDTSSSLKSSSSSQCSYRSDTESYLNDTTHNIKLTRKICVTKRNDNNTNDKGAYQNYSVKPNHNILGSGYIKDNIVDDESVKHDNLSYVKSSENIIPRRQCHQIARCRTDEESIKPCNLRLPPTSFSSPYHIRDNKFSIENVEVENVVDEKSNQRYNVSHATRNCFSKRIGKPAADVNANRYSPHNYHPNQNFILSVDKRCDTSKPTYDDFVTLTPSSAYRKDSDKVSDEICVKNPIKSCNLNDDHNTSIGVLNEHRLTTPCYSVEACKNPEKGGDISCKLNKTSIRYFSKSTPNIAINDKNDKIPAPNSDVKETVLRHPKHTNSKREIPRPISLIEERVEDFHIIHEAGSCEILSSSIPHISVQLPFDTSLTHPKSPSRTFEFCDKSVENITQTKDHKNYLKEEDYNPLNHCYTTTQRRICYRSSIRIMVRPENLLQLQQQEHHPDHPVIPRSNSLEGISSSSSSSNSSVSETARSAKKMSAASLARHKISTHESPEGANTFSDMSSENTQPSIVKEQFR